MPSPWFRTGPPHRQPAGRLALRITLPCLLFVCTGSLFESRFHDRIGSAEIEDFIIDDAKNVTAIAAQRRRGIDGLAMGARVERRRG
jgi:hypothetical protein